MSRKDNVKLTRLRQELPSPYSESEHLLGSAIPHEVSTHSWLPTKGQKGATTTIAWQTILNSGKSNDVNEDHQVGEEQQMESAPAPEDDDDSITTALQRLIADEVRS